MTFCFYSSHVLCCSSCILPCLNPDFCDVTTKLMGFFDTSVLSSFGCKMNYNMNKQQRKSNMWSTVTKGIFVFLKCGRFARAVTPANHKPAQLHLIWNGNKFALWWTGWMSTADITAQTCMPLPTSEFFTHILVYTCLKTHYLTVLSFTQTHSLSW